MISGYKWLPRKNIRWLSTWGGSIKQRYLLRMCWSINLEDCVKMLYVLSAINFSFSFHFNQGLTKDTFICLTLAILYSQFYQGLLCKVLHIFIISYSSRGDQVTLRHYRQPGQSLKMKAGSWCWVTERVGNCGRWSVSLTWEDNSMLP